MILIRCSHGPHRFLTSILPLQTAAGKKELATFRILYVGATIRQCKKHIVKHQHQFIRNTLESFESDALNSFLEGLDQIE